LEESSIRGTSHMRPDARCAERVAASELVPCERRDILLEANRARKRAWAQLCEALLLLQLQCQLCIRFRLTCHGRTMDVALPRDDAQYVRRNLRKWLERGIAARY
jgi:hypothetical protein